LSFEFPLPPENAYDRQLVIKVQSALAASVEELTATVAWSCLEFSEMLGDKALGAAELTGDLVDLVFLRTRRVAVRRRNCVQTIENPLTAVVVEFAS